MVKKGYCGIEGVDLPWDCMGVCQVSLYITTNQLYGTGSYNETKFQKNKVVTGKTPFFMKCSIFTSDSICLNIGFWLGRFVLKCCTFNLSTFNQKRQFSFLEKVFLLQEMYFKVKVVKTFKISSGCHKKTYRSLKRRAILKIPITAF